MILANRTTRTIPLACATMIALAFASPAHAGGTVTTTFYNSTSDYADDFHLEQTYNGTTAVITGIKGSSLQPGQPSTPWAPSAGTGYDPIYSLNAVNSIVGPGQGLSVGITYTGVSPFTFIYWFTGKNMLQVDEDITPHYTGIYTHGRFYVPEPSDITVLLVGAGVVGLLISRRKLITRNIQRSSATS